MTPEAERFNGWAAMLGFVAAVGAYVTTGQIIPGYLMNKAEPKNIEKKNCSREAKRKICNVRFYSSNWSIFNNWSNHSRFYLTKNLRI